MLQLFNVYISRISNQALLLKKRLIFFQSARILLGSQYSPDTQIWTIDWARRDWAEMPIASGTIVGLIYQPIQLIIHES